MSYKDFGLDKDKRSRDKGSVPEKWLCLWCDSKVANGFNLCFSNFVICYDCVEHSHDEVNINRWEDTEHCLKCSAKVIKGYRPHSTYNASVHICDKCIEWAKEVKIGAIAQSIR